MHEKAEEYPYTYKITLLCTGSAVHDLIPFLEKCRVAGAVGHTMEIVTDPGMGKKKGEESFMFDGDGSSGIKRVKVSRLHWKDARDLQTQNGVLYSHDDAWITEKRKNEILKERRHMDKADTCEAVRLVGSGNETPSDAGGQA